MHPAHIEQRHNYVSWTAIQCQQDAECGQVPNKYNRTGLSKMADGCVWLCPPYLKPYLSMFFPPLFALALLRVIRGSFGAGTTFLVFYVWPSHFFVPFMFDRHYYYNISVSVPWCNNLQRFVRKPGWHFTASCYTTKSSLVGLPLSFSHTSKECMPVG